MHKSCFNVWNAVFRFSLQQKGTPFCVRVVRGLAILEEFFGWIRDNSQRDPRIDRFSVGVLGADQFYIALILEGSTSMPSLLIT